MNTDSILYIICNTTKRVMENNFYFHLKWKTKLLARKTISKFSLPFLCDIYTQFKTLISEMVLLAITKECFRKITNSFKVQSFFHYLDNKIIYMVDQIVQPLDFKVILTEINHVLMSQHKSKRFIFVFCENVSYTYSGDILKKIHFSLSIFHVNAKLRRTFALAVESFLRVSKFS